jgi:hypothetical protein
MIKELFVEGINPYLSSDNTLTAGQLVKYDAANPGKILVAGAGEAVAGIVAQDVIAANVDNYKLDSVTHKARVGDKVGVYYGGGVFITDQYSGNITAPGTNLYAGAAGKLVTTVSGNAVAVAETVGNSASGDKIRIKLIG